MYSRGQSALCSLKKTKNKKNKKRKEQKKTRRLPLKKKLIVKTFAPLPANFVPAPLQTTSSKRTIPNYECCGRYTFNQKGKRIDGPCPRICPLFYLKQNYLYCTSCLKDFEDARFFTKADWEKLHTKLLKN